MELKSSERIASIFSQLPTKRICVVGDLVIDHYRTVTAKRVSPEAPVLIVKPEANEFLPGGAANVVANLCAFGVGSVHLVTAAGQQNQEVFDKLALPGSPIVSYEADRMNTVKERIVTRRQQLLRIDHQSGRPIKSETSDALFKAALTALSNADAIVFSDYDHGVCVPSLISPILSMAAAAGIPTIVDSKAKDTLTKYRGATIALPNMDEAKAMTKLEEFEDGDIARYFIRYMKLQAAGITLGPKGILLCTQDEIKTYPPLHKDEAKEVTDVTGAGDTVAATVAIGLATKMSYDEIMKLANVAAGIKVQKRGVATVSEREIVQAIEQDSGIFP